MRLWPKSLAGRLAALLVLTLIAAQLLSFILFAGERVTAFRTAYREHLLTRVITLVDLLEKAPPDLHQRLIDTASSPVLRLGLASDPILAPDEAWPADLRDQLAGALNRTPAEVRLIAGHGAWRSHDRTFRNGRHRPPPWARLSVRLASGQWLNATADLPPVPRLGPIFLVSFLISAFAVAAVGALGVRLASRPLYDLASAAHRLGRGESFAPLPEIGPKETREANMAFNRMRERLDRFIRDRTTMLAAVAHDLRTPITTLRLRAEFIDDEDVKERILGTLADMQAMADSVLDFARADSQTEPTRSVELAALVESIVEDASARGNHVVLETSPPLVLRCRPSALRRAIINLVDNATFYGRSARVRVESAPEEVRILVDDDGPGIPSQELDRVFEPFVRLESSRNRATGGAGLGLAIARSLARSHGGDIRLENRIEGGLRAFIILPRT